VDASLPIPVGGRRRADLLFPGARVACFVDGCFFHCCPEHGTRPHNNADWWAEKLDQNVRRDRDTDANLTAAGWVALRFWAHEDPDAAANLLYEVVRRRTPTRRAAVPAGAGSNGS
jgi:DNA mismatch endonuclease, patch repair protein